MNVSTYKVVFVSNFMNAHQLFLSNSFQKFFGDNYVFIETDRLSEERIRMKFDSLYDKSSSIIISTFNNKRNEDKALDLINDADFVIFGSAPSKFLYSRLQSKKPIFYYTERVFRNGFWRIINPRFFLYLYMNYFHNYNNNLYLLSVGKYTYSDFKKLGLFKDKSFKWGYFPETKYYNINDLIDLKNSQPHLKILWVGRLIKWKHPEHCIKVARDLKSKKINFKIKIVGEGPMLASLIDMINRYYLSEYVEISGFMHSNQIYEEMKKSHIYLMTSDQNEGWGVVVNEAMNCACAVVGSNLVGSISYLIENNKNGLVYKSSSTRDLNLKVLKLINDRRFRTEISINGFSKITKEWNPEIASKNLFNIFDSIAKTGKNLNNNKGPGEKI